MRARHFQDSRLRFHLVLAFLLWSVLPHLSVYRHAHGGKGAGHDHATLTPAEIRLANEVVQSLPPGSDPGFGGEAVPGTPSRDGEPALQSASEALSHTHVQQDPNLVALGMLLEAAPLSPPLIAAPASHPASPGLGHRFERLARGPPSLPSA